MIKILLGKLTPHLAMIAVASVIICAGMGVLLLKSYERAGVIKSDLKEANVKITGLHLQIDQNNKEAEFDLNAARKSIAAYRRSREKDTAKLRLFSTEIEAIKEQNEKIKECLLTVMPDNYIGRLP